MKASPKQKVDLNASEFELERVLHETKSKISLIKQVSVPNYKPKHSYIDHQYNSAMLSTLRSSDYRLTWEKKKIDQVMQSIHTEKIKSPKSNFPAPVLPTITPPSRKTSQNQMFKPYATGDHFNQNSSRDNRKDKKPLFYDFNNMYTVKKMNSDLMYFFPGEENGQDKKKTTAQEFEKTINALLSQVSNLNLKNPQEVLQSISFNGEISPIKKSNTKDSSPSSPLFDPKPVDIKMNITDGEGRFKVINHRFNPEKVQKQIIGKYSGYLADKRFDKQTVVKRMTNEYVNTIEQIQRNVTVIKVPKNFKVWQQDYNDFYHYVEGQEEDFPDSLVEKQLQNYLDKKLATEATKLLEETTDVGLPPLGSTSEGKMGTFQSIGQEMESSKRKERKKFMYDKNSSNEEEDEEEEEDEDYEYYDQEEEEEEEEYDEEEEEEEADEEDDEGQEEGELEEDGEEQNDQEQKARITKKTGPLHSTWTRKYEEESEEEEENGAGPEVSRNKKGNVSNSGYRKDDAKAINFGTAKRKANVNAVEEYRSLPQSELPTQRGGQGETKVNAGPQLKRNQSENINVVKEVGKKKTVSKPKKNADYFPQEGESPSNNNGGLSKMVEEEAISPYSNVEKKKGKAGKGKKIIKIKKQKTKGQQEGESMQEEERDNLSPMSSPKKMGTQAEFSGFENGSKTSVQNTSAVKAKAKEEKASSQTSENMIISRQASQNKSRMMARENSQKLPEIQRKASAFSQVKEENEGGVAKSPLKNEIKSKKENVGQERSGQAPQQGKSEGAKIIKKNVKAAKQEKASQNEQGGENQEEKKKVVPRVMSARVKEDQSKKEKNATGGKTNSVNDIQAESTDEEAQVILDEMQGKGPTLNKGDSNIGPKSNQKNNRGIKIDVKPPGNQNQVAGTSSKNKSPYGKQGTRPHLDKLMTLNYYNSEIHSIRKNEKAGLQMMGQGMGMNLSSKKSENQPQNQQGREQVHRGSIQNQTKSNNSVFVKPGFHKSNTTASFGKNRLVTHNRNEQRFRTQGEEREEEEDNEEEGKREEKKEFDVDKFLKELREKEYKEPTLIDLLLQAPSVLENNVAVKKREADVKVPQHLKFESPEYEKLFNKIYVWHADLKEDLQDESEEHFSEFEDSKSNEDEEEDEEQEEEKEEGKETEKKHGEDDSDEEEDDEDMRKKNFGTRKEVRGILNTED